ncbi:leucine-rich repeat domain-containing protein [Mycoplasma hominis]|uniref:leucine-rich repeat domain-containing protein n=1 Tax=Metamycoplasma hominis TaxID=2098 RepID=UPI0017467671|nr:leucine-rich repeat protein [Metamycoplasma hominis]MBD3899002.1 leucine-rich repeat domain-containing protein [Metamycoplasma hominis]
MKKWTKMLLTLGLVTTSTICFPLVAASCTKTTDSNSNNQNIDNNHTKNNDNKPNDKKPESLKNEDSSTNNENQNVKDNKEKELYELFDFERNSSNNWKITNYNGKQIDVVIPSYFKGKKVEEIDKNASFENCKVKFDNGFDKITKDLTKGLKKIASVTIPENVKSIENEAFKNFKNLKELTLKNGIANIGEGAFEGTQISSISIPSSIKEIKAKTFKDCWYLKKINFSNGIEKIGENAFEGAGVTTIIFPNSLKDVYAKAFYYCDNLKELTLNDGLDSIGEGAFEGTGVTTIIFPNSLKNVYANAFYYCNNLKELTLNDGLDSIGSKAFLGTKISSVTIPSSITRLSEDIFNKDCKIALRNGFEKINRNITGALQHQKSITIPTSVKEIEEGAFKDFKELKEVKLNEGLKSIGDNAFLGTSISSIVLPKNIVSFGRAMFNSDCNIILDSNITYISYGIAKAFENSKKVIIPNSVKEIEEGAFEGFENLKEVVLNEGIERIGKNAFKNRNLEVVTIPNSAKEIGTNAFLAGFQNYYWMPFYHSLKEVYYKGNKKNTPWNWNDIGIDIKIVKEI